MTIISAAVHLLLKTMATFYSVPANQRDVAAAAGDMPFHHYPPHHMYLKSAGLAPLPYTAAASEDRLIAAQGDDRTKVAFIGAAEEEIQRQQQLMMQNGGQAMQRHGLLSLSLGTQAPSASLYRYGTASADASLLGAHRPMSAASASGGAYTGVAVRSSQYLMAARELLDELVNVQEAVATKGNGSGERRDADRSEDKASNRHDPADAAGFEISTAELSSSERLDLENKATALQGMLDQVNQRYRHYQQQMKALASALDSAAGRGAARPYTVLALQTISRHFLSLRNAIDAQAQSTRRSLGVPDAPAHGGGIHRLRYIYQLLRQRRTAQQLGMLPPPHQLNEQQQQQQAAWRPQRGLPESAVSVLRAWLFEHFLHPYPKESEKLMLARQAGLTRGQVSNWFINARVRLWKPMIEEMYREEFGAEMESNSSSENGAGKGKDEAARSPEDLQSPSSAAATCGVREVSPFRSEAMAGADTAVPGISGLDAYSKTGLSLHQRHHPHHGQTQSVNDGVGGSLQQEALALCASNVAGGAERFMEFGSGAAGVGGSNGDSVSLTLGLHRHDGVTVITAGQTGRVRPDGVYAGEFEHLDGPDDRQQFGSPSQLLHDFVT